MDLYPKTFSDLRFPNSRDKKIAAPGIRRRNLVYK